jgi:uncharacterized membrane protein YphA (DoxX/SURF4 family)
MHCTIDSTCSSSASFTPYLVMSVFTALFVGALFLQSGWEKLNDWPGNLSWLKEHFRNTPIKAIVSGVLVILTGLELLSGTIIVAGLIVFLWKGCSIWLLVGYSLACASLLALFTGQRIAKDYAGAASLVPYFLLVLAGLWLLN